jgi:hypothetical protein
MARYNQELCDNMLVAVSMMIDMLFSHPLPRSLSLSLYTLLSNPPPTRAGNAVHLKLIPRFCSHRGRVCKHHFKEQ